MNKEWKGESAETSARSALHGVECGRGSARLFYGMAIVLGIVFLSIGSFVVFNLFARMADAEIFFGKWSLLLVFYAVLNFGIGIGFMLLRKWLLFFFLGNLVLLSTSAAFFLFSGNEARAERLFFGVIYSGIIFLFLAIGRKLLVERQNDFMIGIGFFLLLLCSFVANLL